MFRSTDGGDTWKQVNAGLEVYTDVLEDPVYLIEHLAIDAIDPQRLYAYDFFGKVYKSTNGAEAWSPLTSWTDTSAISLVTDPSAPQTFYVADSKLYGVFITANGGASWWGSSLYAPSRIPISAMAVDTRVPKTIYAGTDGGGVFKWVLSTFSSSVFPQVAIGGNVGSGTYTTIFTFVNTGTDKFDGNLSFSSQDGSPLRANLSTGQERITGSSIPIYFGPGQTVLVRATTASQGDAALRQGWAQVTGFDGTLGGVATFEVRENGVLRSIAGVLATSPVLAASPVYSPLGETKSLKRRIRTCIDTGSTRYPRLSDD